MRVAISMLMATALVACWSSVPPPNLAPVGTIETQPLADLSGDYCYSGDPAELHTFGRGLQDLPFIEWTRLAPGTVVHLIHQRDRTLEFSWTTADGLAERRIFDLQRKGVRWDGGRLVYRPQDEASGARLGVGKGKLEYALHRFRDGRLVVHTMSSEAGLAFLVVPFRERYEAYLELKRVEGPAGCAVAKTVAEGPR